MSAIQICFKCYERFFAGGAGRLVCGVCWPAGIEINWAKVPVSTERRAMNRARASAAGEAEASGQLVNDEE